MSEEDDAASERRFTNRLAVYWEGLRRERHGLIPLGRDVDIDALALDFVAELSVQT